MRRSSFFLVALVVLNTLFSILAPVSYASTTTTLEDSAQYYQLRYGLRNIFDKRVDNHGNGYEPLYGVRNFRLVLNGAVYRGGANNAFNRNGKRHNSNPVPNEGLKNLCEEGFDQAIYLYPTRYSTSAQTTVCRSTRDGSTRTLRYDQISPLGGEKSYKAILKIVHERLQRGNGNPIYLHCWNGWHASGFISALILRQFCGVSGGEAVEYWNRNTDGNNKGAHYDRIRSRIQAFRPYPELMISTEVRSQVCPQTL